MDSKTYWAQREAEALKHYIKDEAEYDRQIQKIYTDMLDGIQSEINAFYGKYAASEGMTIAEAKKKVSKLDIAAYERKAARYVKDASLDRKISGGRTNKKGYYFSTKANEEMRLYNLTMKVNRLEMLKANIGLELIKGHAELETFMEGILKGRTEDELKRQAGILGKTIRGNSRLAHTIPNASFHNATFSDRIWQYQDIMKADLSKLLQTALIQGKNPRTVAKELRKYLIGDKYGKGARYNMERLMRTELARVQTEAQKQSFIRNGFEQYTFHVNGGCCPVCAALSGKHFKVDKMMPGENAPPMHPNCRCSTSAYEDSADYEAWLDYLAKGGATEEWNKLKYKLATKTPTKPKTAPKIDKISDTNDFDSLDDYLDRSYNISVDKSVKSLDFGVVKKALVGVEYILDKCPALAKTLKQITTSKSGVMSCGGAKITFNPHYYTDAAKINNACDSQSKSGFWVKNASPNSIGVHESAHAVEWLMLQKNPAYQYDWQRIDAWNKCTEAKDIVSQACKNVKKTEFGKGKRNFQLIGSISRYAGETASETMAEAFADVYANGENASPLSVEIERLTWEKLSSYEGGQTP